MRSQNVNLSIGKFEVKLEISALLSFYVFIISLIILATVGIQYLPLDLFFPEQPAVAPVTEVAAEKAEAASTEDEVPTEGLVTFHSIYTLDCNITTNSGLRMDHVEKILHGSGFVGYEQYFLDAEAVHGINVWALIGIAWHESAAGTHGTAVARNNFFGWNWSNQASFDSPQEGIMGVAERISRLYLDPAGSFYNGPTLAGMNIYYAEDPQWAQKVLGTIIMLEGKL